MKLRDYQKQISQRASELVKKFGLAYLAMECRTGKTITALETARKCGAKSVLFITKKKAMTSIRNDYDTLRTVTPLYAIEIINYESVHKCMGGYDFVIIDEAHSLGAYPRPSQRAKRIKVLCAGLPVLFLSGTPSPESYSQIYHQFYVCEYSPFRNYKNFYKWAHDYVSVVKKQINGFYINDYSKADESKIFNFVGHLFLRYTQQEAGFSTRINEHDVVVEMSNCTSRLIKELSRDSIAYCRGTILGDTPAKKLTKLHQLSSGTVITEEGMRLILDESKAAYIQNNFVGKLAIFYVYEAEFDLLKKHFPKWTDNPEEFQQSKDRPFICQVRKAREGIRLDSADALIFFNFEYSYLSYEQTKNRIVSKEKQTISDVYFLCADSGIEKDILKAVRNKKDFTLSYYNRLHKHD